MRELHDFREGFLPLVVFTNVARRNLLCAKILIQNKPRLFLVDTGSSESYLFCKIIGCKIISPEIKSNTVDVEGNEFKLLKVEYDGTYFWWSSTVPKLYAELQKQFGVTIDGAIGLDLLMRYKINLDFSNISS